MTGSDTPPGRASPAGQPAGDPATITVTVWHNIIRDGAGRYTGFHYGFRPGDQMVKVFTCQTGTRGRRPEDVAEDAYAAFNGFPRDDEAAERLRRYAARRSAQVAVVSRKLLVLRQVVLVSPLRLVGQIAVELGERASRKCLSGTGR